MEDNIRINIEKIALKEEGDWKETSHIFLDISGKKEGEKSLSFITKEGYERIKNDLFKGFCHRKFKANFVISGIDLEKLQLGQVVKIGRSKIKITQKGKECYSKCFVTEKLHDSCGIHHHIFFGETVEEGWVTLKDTIEIKGV